MLRFLKPGPHKPYHQYLDAPPTYWSCDASIRALLCNGAGPAGKGWIVPDTIYGLNITEAANIHDWMYVWGEKLDDKNKADMTFLMNLMRIIDERTTRIPIAGHIMRWLRHRRALTYYEAVATFGTRAYGAARSARAALPPDFVNPDILKSGPRGIDSPPGKVFSKLSGITNTVQPIEACTLPPPGWYCTRPKGHSGPCAAHLS